VWSLAIEEQFYLIWPLIVTFCNTRNLIRVCVALLIVAPLFRFVIVAIDPGHANQEAAYTFAIARFDALAAGALMAIVYRNESAKQILLAYFAPVLLACIGLMVIAVVVMRGFAATQMPFGFFNQTNAIVFSACLIALGFSSNHRYGLNFVATVLRHPILAFMAKYSYAMYLLHPPIKLTYLNYVGQRTAESLFGRIGYVLLDWSVVLGVTIAFSMLTWIVIERPFLSLSAKRPEPAISN
jgi:peptidoglycan/LPS O-acetylase OafA/YrhL